MLFIVSYFSDLLLQDLILFFDNVAAKLGIQRIRDNMYKN